MWANIKLIKNTAAISTYIVLGLLIVLPLFLVPPLHVLAYELPKVIVFYISTLILFVFNFKNRKVKFSKFDLLLIFILGISTISLAVNFSPITLFGNLFRLQGTLTLWFLLLFAYTTKNFKIQIPQNLVLQGLSSLLFLQFFLGATDAGRYAGTLGEPNALGATVLFLWPLAFFAKVKNGHSFLLKVYPLVLVVTMLTLSGSKSALLGFAAQAMFYVLTRLKVAYKKSLVMVTVLIVTAILAAPSFKISGNFYENRIAIWKTAAYAAFGSPIYGFGFGNIAKPFHQTAHYLSNSVQWTFVDSAHNIILDWWLQGGVLGLLAISYLLATTTKNFSQNKNRQYLICFIGIFTVLVFNPASIVNLIAFWWLVGQNARSELDI
ncbi:O-antigen ligase family protein [Candidatus Curtissbacteria bacterium]|nr:O-antigen ligase family protein [Candidatus Curtissbacteria bacterium]